MQTDLNCINWKKSGVIIGWLGIIASVGCAACIGPQFVTLPAPNLVVFFVNLIACLVWLYGIDKKKSRCMQVTLVWWAILLVLGAYYIGKQITGNDKSFQFSDNYVYYSVAAFYVIIYLLAVLSYRRMRIECGNMSEIPRFSTSYSVSTIKTT